MPFFSQVWEQRGVYTTAARRQLLWLRNAQAREQYLARNCQARPNSQLCNTDSDPTESFDGQVECRCNAPVNGPLPPLLLLLLLAAAAPPPAHERVRVGGTKGGITQGEGNYTGHYQGEGSATEMKDTGDAVKE
jgi:hypothetical protein